MRIKERIMFLLFRYTSNDICDWYDVVNGHECSLKDGHSGSHIADEIYYVKPIWTVLS